MPEHFHMQTMTPAEAAKKLECPVARTFGKTDTAMCRGDRCAVWRFLPMDMDDAPIKSAIQREMQAIADERGKQVSPIFHKEAVKRVMADPSAYAIPAHHERGFCGLGGKP